MSTDTLTQDSPAGLAAGLPDDLKLTQWRLVRSEWLKFGRCAPPTSPLGATVVGMIAFGACRGVAVPGA
ncbi:MAG TPA: hypothetical protein VFX16_25125 [Pseudonocardiaceae bacterium]|nr:hypothetical protein [Pseudonocardiaceae bacterium]